MKKNRLLILVVLIAGSMQNISAQDIHFSQYDVTHLINNPALTGYFTGDHRAVLNYKEQWKSVAAPYKTAAIQYDGLYFRSKFRNKERVGIGICAFNDKAGAGNMGINQISLSGSFFKPVSRLHTLSAGFQAGYAQHSLDRNALSWGNQYDGNYNPSLPTGELTYNNDNYSYIDIATGLLWDYKKDKYLSMNFGVALQHANYIRLTFMNGEDQNLYRKFTVHGGLEKKIKKSETTFYPSFIFRKQGPSQELIYGCLIKYQLDEERFQGNVLETAINFGAYHRYGDAFIFVMRFSYMHFTLGLSYDVNSSKLSEASHYKGGLELSLIYVTPYVKRSKGNSLL